MSHFDIRAAWFSLPEYARNVFPELAFKAVDDQYVDEAESFDRLRAARTQNRRSVEAFEKRQQDRKIWFALFIGDAKAAARYIKHTCVHLRIDGLYHTQAQTVRESEAIMHQLRPTLMEVVKLGISEFELYGRTDRLEDLRNGFVLILPAIRLCPTLIPYAEAELSKLLHSKEGDFIPSLVIPSFRAEGYYRDDISEGDIGFLSIWTHRPDDERGRALGCHIAGYEAKPHNGWQLLKMHPRYAVIDIRKKADLFRRAVIENTYRKCLDHHANPLRLNARFAKMHIGLHAISPTPYQNLQPDLHRNMLGIMNIVGTEMRKVRKEFPREAKHLFNVFAGMHRPLGISRKQSQSPELLHEELRP